jgi:hypothetical protein
MFATAVDIVFFDWASLTSDAFSRARNDLTYTEEQDFD